MSDINHVAEALVHATLALVEQQRIANLIALAQLSGLTEEALAEMGDRACYEGLVNVVRTNGTQVSDPDDYVELRRTIASALGIGGAKSRSILHRRDVADNGPVPIEWADDDTELDGRA